MIYIAGLIIHPTHQQTSVSYVIIHYHPLYVAALATSDNIQLILRKVFWENFLPRSRIRCRPCRSGAAARGIVGLNKYTNWHRNPAQHTVNICCYVTRMRKAIWVDISSRNSSRSVKLWLPGCGSAILPPLPFPAFCHYHPSGPADNSMTCLEKAYNNGNRVKLCRNSGTGL